MATAWTIDSLALSSNSSSTIDIKPTFLYNGSYYTYWVVWSLASSIYCAKVDETGSVLDGPNLVANDFSGNGFVRMHYNESTGVIAVAYSNSTPSVILTTSSDGSSWTDEVLIDDSNIYYSGLRYQEPLEYSVSGMEYIGSEYKVAIISYGNTDLYGYRNINIILRQNSSDIVIGIYSLSGTSFDLVPMGNVDYEDYCVTGFNGGTSGWGYRGGFYYGSIASIINISKTSNIIGGNITTPDGLLTKNPSFFSARDASLNISESSDSTGYLWSTNSGIASDLSPSLTDCEMFGAQYVKHISDTYASAVAFYNYAESGLSVYWRDTQTQEDIDIVGDVGRCPAMTWNRQGRPFVVYGGVANLKFASFTEENNSSSSTSSESSDSSVTLPDNSSSSSKSTSQTISESSSTSSSSESTESSSVLNPYVMGVPIMYPSVQRNIVDANSMFAAFGSIEYLTKSFIWSDSRAVEVIIQSPAKYSSYSNNFTASAGNVWNFNKAPSFDLGINIKTYIRAVLYPFAGSSVQDLSGIIKYLEYRIANDNWIRLDAVNSDYDSALDSVQYHFKKAGSIPCQLRVILDDEEIIYSSEKYVFVTTENETEVQSFLTSRTDSYTSDSDNSLGGICSRASVNVSASITQNLGMSSSQNYIEVDSLVGFANSGYVSVGDEVISYNSKAYSYPYRLSGCIRGRFGTVPSYHKKETKVRLINNESLFNHITSTDLTKDDKIDYKCVCLKNVKDIETGDISIYFSMLPPEYSNEKISFAIERAVSGNTTFSQEIVGEYAEPFVSSTTVHQITNLTPSQFLWNGSVDKAFDVSTGFGYISKRNIEDDGNYVYLDKESIEGEVIYRFYNSTFFTADLISYNSSSIDDTSVIVSYRYGDTETEILSESWVEYEIEEHEALTESTRDIKKYCKYLDIKIKLERKEISDSSPSIGDFNFIYWTKGYSRFVEYGGEQTARSLVIDGNHFRKIFDEFYVDYVEETSSNLKPLIGDDQYIIQSTYANAIGSASYPIKFNQGLVFSFVPHQDCELNEISVFEKRIDWDDSTYSSIDLTLNLIVYDGDPEQGGKVIGSSSQDLSLTSKVTHASKRVFSLARALPLIDGETYWVYMYCESDPSVKGEWRFRGSYDMLYGNPDNNLVKVYEISGGIEKRYELDGFAIGFTAIGKLSNVLTGHHAENSTIYYRLAPSGLSSDWEFTGINLTVSSPYNHPYNIGPYIHAMWKKDTDDGWHRFRPRKISMNNGTILLAPSSVYKTIGSEESIIVRVEIDKILDSDNLDDIRGFGEYGLGVQPTISRIEVAWKQDIAVDFIQNAVTRWIEAPVGNSNAIKLSDMYPGWTDNLLPYEQFFVWIRRDYSKVKAPVRDSGFTMVVNHGVEKFYELSEYNADDWTPVSSAVIPGAPSSIIVPSYSNDGVYEVSWASVDGAVFYELQESSGTYQTIALTSENSYIVSGKTSGTYTHRVRAINSAGYGEYVISASIAVNISVREESSSSSLSSISSLSSDSSSSESSSSKSSSSQSSSSESSSSV